MDALATSMALFMLALVCATGQALAAAIDRDPPRVAPSATPTAEQEYSRGIAARNATSSA